MLVDPYLVPEPYALTGSNCRRNKYLFADIGLPSWSFPLNLSDEIQEYRVGICWLTGRHLRDTVLLHYLAFGDGAITGRRSSAGEGDCLLSPVEV